MTKFLPITGYLVNLIKTKAREHFFKKNPSLKMDAQAIKFIFTVKAAIQIFILKI